MNAIVLEQVSKCYPRYHAITQGVKTSLLRLPETIRTMRREKFFALKNVSFAIQKGETVGIIGANGSGKSTLLSLMAGVLSPDAGLIDVRGRVCPLLELGAGFHPDLTGRENIVLNGVLLGLTKAEVNERLNDIIRFSELESFIDQPLRTYSTGMMARLGFSVAAHLTPDVLLIDEVLAVGDLHFQKKCHRAIADLQEQRLTIVLVSHSSEDIRRLCTRVIWLDVGKVVADESPDVLRRYEECSEVVGR